MFHSNKEMKRIEMKIQLRLVLPLIWALVNASNLMADDSAPFVPIGFKVDVVAKEPLVSNPCVMAFDGQGRLFVAQGPQWRNAPESPGDRVDLMLDVDGDGVADRRKTFARGFNSIQGLAWHGKDLWIANAPDLTIARDTDGDDQADQYIRVYTGLGNLEHSLHGLQFGPDGRLYMSKGNSKGYNRPDQLAPRSFRELWGLKSPPGSPDYTEIEYFAAGKYRRNQHTPADDWGREGGILSCVPYRDGKPWARDLRIESRGFRNPWDLAYDDGFNWLCTDNDQSAGDRILMPFRTAHFGWGHPWSFHWTGKNHLPTVPVSGPLFEGSGTGIVYYNSKQFPESYRNVFFYGDWLQREICLFRPTWQGALMTAGHVTPRPFARAGSGRTMPKSDGPVFDPTDIEVGPDGALYILSWGHEYGGVLNGEEQKNAGRVYRIRYTANPLLDWRKPKRKKILDDWTLDELFDDLVSPVPAWRVNAQNMFLARGKKSAEFLLRKLGSWKELGPREQTWTIWTLARLGRLPLVNDWLAPDVDCSFRVQLIRGLCSQTDQDGTRSFESCLPKLLNDPEPRIRFAATQAILDRKLEPLAGLLLERLAVENDRLTYYLLWNVIKKLLPADQRRKLLEDSRPQVKVGLFLGLAADDDLTAETARQLADDGAPDVKEIARMWLEKSGVEKPVVSPDPPPGIYSGPILVTLKSRLNGTRITYTLDGSEPTTTSMPYRIPIAIQADCTIKIAVIQDNRLHGRVQTAEYRIQELPEFHGQPIVTGIHVPSKRVYEFDSLGIQKGKRVYTDRDYVFDRVPEEIRYAPYLRVANNDDRSRGHRWLSFELREPVDLLVGVDTRNPEPLEWMRIGQQDGFFDTGLTVGSTDADFRLYRKKQQGGKIVLGGNTNRTDDTGRGNYIVIFDRKLMQPGERPVSVDAVRAEMANADPERGRELFLHPRGAGCYKCHRMDGMGQQLAPDLTDIGSRVKDPGTIIQSILEPGLVITEGFAQQLFALKDGRTVQGSVVEQTARQFKVADSNGKVITLRVSDIEQQKTLKKSTMPEGFGKQMSARQVADLTAWLMSQKRTGDRNGFSFRDAASHLELYFRDQKIGTYLKRHPRLTRPAFVNLRTPRGVRVTRRFPPRAPEDVDPGYQGGNGIIHPIMHPGLWISFGDLNGNDYWRLKAPVRVESYSVNPQANSEEFRFGVVKRYLAENQKSTVCRETTTYRWQKVPEGFLVRIDTRFRSDDHDFYFGDQEESGLAIRVASPIRVNGGNGTILNDQGKRNGPAVRGSRSRWFDYFGNIGDRQVGILVVSAPKNPETTWLHARDYGVVVTNPFPMQPKERREPFVKTFVKRGQDWRLSYAVLIHDLPSSKPLDQKKTAESLMRKFD